MFRTIVTDHPDTQSAWDLRGEPSLLLLYVFCRRIQRSAPHRRLQGASGYAAAMESQRRPRVHLRSAFPEAHAALTALDDAVSGGRLEPALLELIRLRASQINGCAYCIDLHVQRAREQGERLQRLDVLGTWRETALFNERERAALALTERVTLVAGGGVPEYDIVAAREHFDETELVSVLYAIATINAWNRLSIAAGVPVPARREDPVTR